MSQPIQRHAFRFHNTLFSGTDSSPPCSFTPVIDTGWEESINESNRYDTPRHDGIPHQGNIAHIGKTSLEIFTAHAFSDLTTIYLCLPAIHKPCRCEHVDESYSELQTTTNLLLRWYCLSMAPSVWYLSFHQHHTWPRLRTLISPSSARRQDRYIGMPTSTFPATTSSLLMIKRAE